MELVFVPVKLDEGFDFSLFLEDLGFELPMNLMLARMRQQHPVVVRALRAALEPQPQPWEGWRTAGTLVAFRPLAPTPWVEEELARREAERAEKDAEVEERLTDPDPGVRGETIHELDDAAAVVARLLSALERIDELERVPQPPASSRMPARRSTRASAAPRPPSARPPRSAARCRTSGPPAPTSSCWPAWSAWSAPASTSSSPPSTPPRRSSAPRPPAARSPGAWSRPTPLAPTSRPAWRSPTPRAPRSCTA